MGCALPPGDRVRIVGWNCKGPFKKLWSETVLFNSHSGDKRCVAVLIGDGTPIENIDFQNIIKDNLSKLTFNVKN